MLEIFVILGIQRGEQRNMVKVSVIIAVYNVETYLEKCLDSLINQSLEEIEIIAVNDGSTDGSQEILNRYMKKSTKLKCYMKENGGAADARNHGLRYAVGEFVGYVDSDDFVDLNMYEVLYKKAKEKNSDIVECNLRHTYATGEDIEIMDRYFDSQELLMFGRYVVWNKIYNRKWLLEAEAEFPVHLIYEDVEFIARLVPYIKTYDYVDIAPIHYVQRRSSINNSTSNKTLHILQILKNIIAFYKEKGFYEEYEEALEYFYMRIILCSSLSRMCRMDNKIQRKMALKENWELLVDTFPNWKKNKVLKNKKSHQALFMKTINAASYPAYSVLFTLFYQINGKFSRKWK